MCEQTITFCTKAHFWFFFSKSCLKVGGCGLYTSAAYTRVFTVFKAESRQHDTLQLIDEKELTFNESNPQTLNNDDID